jgi:hypothetical protein
MTTTIKKTIGTGKDYTNLADYLTYLSTRDLRASGLDTIEQGEIYNINDVAALTLSGAVTDATHYIELFPAAGKHHSGKWDTNGINLTLSVDFGAVLTISGVNHVRIKGFQLKNSAVLDNNARCIELSGLSSGCDIWIEESILRGSGTGTASASSSCIRSVTPTGGRVRVANTIGYDSGNGFRDPSGNSTVEFDLYDNLWRDNQRYGISISNSAATRRLKANIGQSNALGDYDISGTGTDDYAANISSDATSPTVAGRSKTVSFVDAPNDDFHLASGDTAAKGNGVDLSADANWAISRDASGATRARTDAGPNEFVASTSAALTGTGAAGMTGAEVRAGGKTIIITLTGDTFVAAGAAFDAIRQAIIDGFVAATSPAWGWNAVRAQIPVTAVARTSSTVATLTLPALPGFQSNTTLTVTGTVPAAAVVGGVALVAAPTIAIARTVTDVTPSGSYTMRGTATRVTP